MKLDKRKKIEKAGWKVGSADEFLGLTKEESAYIEMKLSLSDALKNERIKRQISQVELAKLISSSQSRVAKMEAADPSVSVDLIVRSLLALGVSRRQVANSVAA
jgi:ribosome-binding protein aMBF1 (putative translation factor)|tara:strand:- start:116 stop:427 length:312 start_codon:yes stop_codon:yes gene_type:complete